MVWGLFKKRGNNELSHEAIKGSFSNIKKDMNHLGKWVNHFKDKHEYHENNQKEILERLEKLESLLALQQTSNIEENDTSLEEDSLPELPESGLHDELSLTEKSVCKILSRLHNEVGDWISLRQLAAEIYPEKEYSKSRSAMGQLIKKLEEKDYVVKRVTKKCAYVHLQKDKDHFLEKGEKVTTRKKKKKQK